MSSTEGAIYLYWPSCKNSKNFVEPKKNHSLKFIQEKKLLSAIEKDLDYYKDKGNISYIDCIHFGGDFSLSFPLKILKSSLDVIKRKFIVDPASEISIEMKPENINNDILESYRSIGINRVSIGVKSFSNSNLKILNTNHNKTTALKSIKLAFSFFKNISIDLMYGIPFSSKCDWLNDIEIASSLPITHISTDEFTDERNENTSLFFNTKSFLVITNRKLKIKKFSSYETSNYAKEGYESKYNLAIFNMKNLIGVGPFVHGRLIKKNKILLLQNLGSKEKWLRGNMKIGKKNLRKNQILEEFLIQGLKTNHGVDLDYIEKKFNLCLKKNINYENIFNLSMKGLLKKKNNRYSLAIHARNIQNSIISHILI